MTGTAHAAGRPVREVYCPRCESLGYEVGFTGTQMFDCGVTRKGRDGKLEPSHACPIIADLRRKLKLTRSGHLPSPIRSGAVASAGLANTYKRLWQSSIDRLP